MTTSIDTDKYFTSLQYTYPIYDSKIEAPSHIPRDILLSQTLKLPRISEISQPTKSNKPINKVFHGNMPTPKYENPLNSILQASRTKIEGFLIDIEKNNHADNDINYNSSKLTSGKNHNRITRKGDSESTITSSTSTTRSNMAIINGSNSNKSTPVTNKTIYFSPSGKVKQRSATPVSVVKDTHNNTLKRKSSKNIKQKLLRMDQASLVSMSNNKSTGSSGSTSGSGVNIGAMSGGSAVSGTTANSQFSIHNDADDHEDSDYDHLACHADNIMRMAVDSTMLGSTFNSSFSSSFSNSFTNENTGKDFFDKEAKQSILDGLNF